MHKRSLVVLLILDGFGFSEDKSYNAIAKAHTPIWDSWWKSCPHVLLDASGASVGLPIGQMGNSEVGHMHIGAGRILDQDFTRISRAITTNEFAKNPIFNATIKEMQEKHQAIHVLGLLSEGGVHSHEEHLFAFLALCFHMNFTNVHLHLFLDGRDTPPKSAKESLLRLNKILSRYPVAKISSISGRYYSMDRDNRWQRIERTYRVLTKASDSEIPWFNTAEDALDAYYTENITDEFVPPTFIGNHTPIKDNDSVFFFNFRADRARELTETLTNDAFDAFPRSNRPKLAHFISMTHYADFLATEPAFMPQTINNTLGEVIAQHGLKQLRVAETEKYAHVTFFFNGGQEQVFKNEERKLIASPAIATYDLEPWMSATKITNYLVDAIKSEKYDVIICNYANADMVGHTGNMEATIEAIHALDTAMGEVGQAVAAVNGHLLITADHGNAELMFDEKTKQAHTAHTNGPVPLLYFGDKNRKFKPILGGLIDVAPTLLDLLYIKPPAEMTGNSLWMEHVNDA